MKMDQQDYCKLLSTAAKTTYSQIGSIFCQILQKNVTFNAKGFHHLHYKPDGTARKSNEIICKLTLLPLASAVIKNAIGIHEERDVTVRTSRKEGAEKLKAKQYALVATVGRKNPVSVRVIILDVENSPNPIFWSIMKH